MPGPLAGPLHTELSTLRPEVAADELLDAAGWVEEPPDAPPDPDELVAPDAWEVAPEPAAPEEADPAAPEVDP